jgi:hypothetical protein
MNAQLAVFIINFQKDGSDEKTAQHKKKFYTINKPHVRKPRKHFIDNKSAMTHNHN